MGNYFVSIACDSDLEGYDCCGNCSDYYDTLDEALAEAKSWDEDIWSVSVRDLTSNKIIYSH